MKHLYFIRHGLSKANVDGVWSGNLDTPLLPEGHEQAKKAAKKAAQDGLKFDVIISSPLKRAYDTAQYIAKATGYPVNEILLHNDLKERNFGVLEGAANEQARLDYLVHESNIDRYEGVEALADLETRVNKVLEELKARPEDTILLVGHGAFARALKHRIEGIPMSVHIEPYPNAEIFKLI